MRNKEKEIINELELQTMRATISKTLEIVGQNMKDHGFSMGVPSHAELERKKQQKALNKLVYKAELQNMKAVVSKTLALVNKTMVRNGFLSTPSQDELKQKKSKIRSTDGAVVDTGTQQRNDATRSFIEVEQIIHVPHHYAKSSLVGVSDSVLLMNNSVGEISIDSYELNEIFNYNANKSIFEERVSLNDEIHLKDALNQQVFIENLNALANSTDQFTTTSGNRLGTLPADRLLLRAQDISVKANTWGETMPIVEPKNSNDFDFSSMMTVQNKKRSRSDSDVSYKKPKGANARINCQVGRLRMN